MSAFDRIEEQREFVDGLEHEDWRERMAAEDDPFDAYPIRDPKHPDHYEAMADIWDNREKCA